MSYSEYEQTIKDLEEELLEKDKEIDVLKAKYLKLKQLILLTDPAVSNMQSVSETQLRQWGEFLDCFPDER